MKAFKSDLRFWILPLFLLAGSCTSDPGDGGDPPAGTKPSYGGFRVSLEPPANGSPAYTSVVGQLTDGPTPTAPKSEGPLVGACRLLKPKNPFCEPCGSKALCVDDNKCEPYANPQEAGKVRVTGLKTTAGAASFAMDPIQMNYQPAAGLTVGFPPFAEGDVVTFAAAGNDSIAGFTLSAPGISPLNVLNDTLVLADGKPLNLSWTPPAKPGSSKVSVTVDISHHGGTKGEIECETPDTGNLEIPAALVDQLKALGIAGFPIIEISRLSVGEKAGVHANLVLESRIVKSLTIPGLVSCDSDEECPDGQTCQVDKRCN